ncbi:MAG: hypothetical protein AB4372_34930 [Xenococcus sp. (in: cyanobacteria)]
MAKDIDEFQSKFEENILKLRESLKNYKISTLTSSVSKEEFFTELSRLSVAIQELEKSAFERFPANWKELYYLSEDLSLAIQLLVRDESNARYIRSIRLNIEEKIIKYATPINHIKRFFSIRHKRAIESNFIVSKIAYGLTISSSISFVLLLCAFFSRLSYLESTNRLKFFALRDQIEFINFRLNDAERELRLIQTEPFESSDSSNDRIKAREKTLKDEIEKLRSEKKKQEESLDRLDIGAFSASIDDTGILLIAIASGTLGSTVSIFIRIKDFEITEKKHDDPIVPILIGLFRPLIGAAFSLFLYSIISSGVVSVEKLVPADEDSSNKMFFYISVSFVAGFSEQFARSYIRKTEELLGGELQNKTELQNELNKIKSLREDLDSLKIELAKRSQGDVEEDPKVP